MGHPAWYEKQGPPREVLVVGEMPDPIVKATFSSQEFESATAFCAGRGPTGPTLVELWYF